MRKHFLLLFLMALLPLAGWAQVDISDGWSITLTPANASYTGGDLTPVVTLTKGGEALNASKFNVSWDKAERINVDADGYTVTVTPNMTNTYGDLAIKTKKFWILKANSELTTTPVIASNTTYAAVQESGNAYNLVGTAGVASFGDVEYIESADEPTANAAGWSTSIPTATSAGDHKVWYRVQGTDNYNGIAITLLGTVTIAGTDPTITTVPAAVGELTYKGTAQQLITAGAVAAGHGTLKYKLGAAGEWTTDATKIKGTDADNYTVYYMVEGDAGYKTTEPEEIAVSIAKASPVITAPTAATELTYNAAERALLSAEGSATLDAPVVYTIAYKAPSAETFDEPGDPVAYANVKATNAGTYHIVAKVVESANFNEVESATYVDVTIAQKAAAAPFAIAGLKYTGAAQQLISAGEAGIVQYKLGEGEWTTDASTITGTNAANYTVQYKVEDANYVAIEATNIANVKISGALLTVTVNNVTKEYDGNTTISDITASDYNILTSVAGYNAANIAYAAIDAANKNAGTHEGVVTITDAFANDNPNFEVTVIPGNLIITEKELYVTANMGLTTDMDTPLDISNSYVVTGIVGEDEPWAEEGAPVLTSNAPDPLVPGTFTLSFTEGTLKTNGNYKMRAENPYVIPVGANFVVTAAAGSKVIITVAPHEKVYGSNDPDYSSWVAGTDYYVTGLAEGDAIATITFTRTGDENVGVYALSATATVNHPDYYADGIDYNNSTFEITPKELVATVNQQVVRIGGTVDDIDADAWSVSGLEFDDTKDDLNGELSISSTDAETTTGTITLAIDNDNYTLKAGTNIGTLIVINNTTLVLDDTDADVVDKINAFAGQNATVKIKLGSRDTRTLGGERKWAAEQWNTLTLPFDISVAELSQILGYAIVNVVNEEGYSDASGAPVYKFNLTMKGGNGNEEKLKANKPFVVKTTEALADLIDENGYVNFGVQAIVAPTEDDLSGVAAGGNSMFKPTYATKTVTSADNGKIWFLLGNYKEWAYITSTSPNQWNIVPFEGFIDQTANLSRTEDATFLMEEIDGSVTAIKSVNVDNLGIKMSPEGWFNLRGMKLQGAPTEKGVYIKDGKKIVIK
ncbi:MAG: hypothetical protein IJV44_09150 [Prevotella sp.]|nr:hypothetical protein [Prevotella sp.]